MATRKRVAMSHTAPCEGNLLPLPTLLTHADAFS